MAWAFEKCFEQVSRSLALYIARTIFKEAGPAGSCTILFCTHASNRCTRHRTHRPDGMTVTGGADRVLDQAVRKMVLDTVPRIGISAYYGRRWSTVHCTKAILLMDEWHSELVLLGPQLGEGVAAAIEDTSFETPSCMQWLPKL